MPRRYPAGGNYRGQYGYQQQPSIGQYESFFNPIPIEFLQEQLGRRQQQYDVSFAGALGAKEALGQEQVGMADIASKNQIIQEGMSNIDKMVEEKYGGDWGRASKEIARSVTQMRSDPFWNAQKEVEKRRTAFQEQVTKFGPQAMVFGQDPRQLSTMDEFGRVRGQEQFTGRVVEQGDWGKTARAIFSSLTPDKIQSAGLTELEKGYLAAGEITRISSTKLQKLAQDPDVQRAFQQAHPEFVEGFEQLDETQKRKFGLEGESLAEATEKTLYGNIAPAAFEQRERQILYDRQAAELRKAIGDAPNPYWGSANYQPIVSTEAGSRLKAHQDRIAEPSAAGRVGTPLAGGPLGISPVFYDDMTEAERETERQRVLGVREADLDSYYSEIQGEYDELKDLSREEGFKAYEDYLSNAAEQARLSWNMKLEDASINVKTQLFSNINSGNFTTPDLEASGDVFDKNNFAKEMGYKDYKEFEEAIGDKKLDTKVNITEGRISVTIPKKAKRGKGMKPAEISFKADVQTQDMLDSAQAVTEAFYGSDDYAEGDMEPQAILDHRGQPTQYAVYVEGTGNIVEGNEKTLWLVDYANQTRQPVSVEKYQEMVAGHIDTRFNNYEGLIGNKGKIGG